MNVRHLFTILLFNFILFFAQAQEQKMSATEINAFKKVLTNNKNVKTITADFSQYKKVGYVKSEIASSGKFYIQHPNKMAWVYTQPISSAMIFNNNKLILTEKGKTKKMDLGRSKQFEKISEAIQANVNGSVYEGTDFTASYYQTSKSYILKLDPISKETKKAMKQLTVTFDKATSQVAELKIIDPSNGYTRFVMSNHQLNSPLDSKIFGD